jgi:2-C-methyl-D-erythritol 4-phosphate cytidylyltransferase
MKKYAVIVAGGKGSRMKSDVPKQFLLVKGKPVLYYTLDSFLKTFADINIILVLPEDHIAAGQEIIDAFFSYNHITTTTGGRTRFHSVKNGLKMINEEGIVFVHDAVRALASSDLLSRTYDAVLKYGSAVPVVPCRDSLRILNESGSDVIDRDLIRLVQTPQAFYSKILIPAFNIDYKDKFTDEASVVEAFGLHVYLVDGEETNIKITHPFDLLLMEKILDERSA